MRLAIVLLTNHYFYKIFPQYCTFHSTTIRYKIILLWRRSVVIFYPPTSREHSSKHTIHICSMVFALSSRTYSFRAQHSRDPIAETTTRPQCAASRAGYLEQQIEQYAAAIATSEEFTHAQNTTREKKRRTQILLGGSIQVMTTTERRGTSPSTQKTEAHNVV